MDGCSVGTSAPWVAEVPTETADIGFLRAPRAFLPLANPGGPAGDGVALDCTLGGVSLGLVSHRLCPPSLSGQHTS